MPTPRMLGRSSRAGVSTGDARHPLASLADALHVLAQVGFRCSSGPLRGVATGDGRHLQPSPLRGRAARAAASAHAVLQIRRICLSLPYRRGGQNRINSVGHFYFVKSDAAKQLPTSPGASPGPLGDSGKIRVPRLRRPNLFLLLRPKGWPFGNPRLLRNTPGPHPGFFVGPEKQNTHHQP